MNKSYGDDIISTNDLNKILPSDLLNEMEGDYINNFIEKEEMKINNFFNEEVSKILFI